jgi:hypothetical protein
MNATFKPLRQAQLKPSTQKLPKQGKICRLAVKQAIPNQLHMCAKNRMARPALNPPICLQKSILHCKKNRPRNLMTMNLTTLCRLFVPNMEHQKRRARRSVLNLRAIPYHL